MPYYMQHPEHGVHICYTPEDVEAHKAIGWVMRDENTNEYGDSEKISYSTIGEPSDFSQPKKRGRKPKAK